MKSSSLIRQEFLDFFKSKGHLIVPSAPLVIKDDPTLMFTNAGMNQFKDFFLGNKAATDSRIADTQKCLRVSGKHNDLEEVGIDTYHHTLFEMLGNWSFGDYFKKEAISWSWELLTEVYGLPKEKLYATVFGGDEKENLPPDNEAFELWKAFLPEDHILYGSKKDNFWEMGETGPCGPCTEIHIDLRSDEDIKDAPGRLLVNESHPQVIEIWNNVFMEFNRLANGTLQPLPAKHVDTGMGFERLCMAIQGKQSTYDTDVFTPTLDFITTQTKIKYGQALETDIAMRVIADHIRAVSFTIADGQLPSNNKAGYVIRRILRRAIRYYFNFLNIKEPFLYKLVTLLSEQFGQVFPEIRQQKEFIAKVIYEEEVAFLRTLENGLKRLDSILSSLPEGHKVLSGQLAFELLDTFGFPLDLTALICREKGIEVDVAGFEAAMIAQKERSRQATNLTFGDWVWMIAEGSEQNKFVGYDKLTCVTKITRYRQVINKGRIQCQIVLATNPFYANSGGQVGDTGTIKGYDNSIVLQIVDTVKENDLSLLITEDDDALEALLRLDGQIVATVDGQRRTKVTAHHSATHLLHAALRGHLGGHVQQKGSLVNDQLLRFDFSHFTKVEPDQLKAIEREVNEKIRLNISLLEERNVPLEEAKAKGAMALFGEKYAEHVRVITFDPAYSVELCGGTHVKQTGEIGFFKITSESSSSAGVRRIEAVAGEAAFDLIENQSLQVNTLKLLTKSNDDFLSSVEQLVEDKTRLQKQIEALQNQILAYAKIDLLGQVKTHPSGVRYISSVVDAPSVDAVKQLAYDIRHTDNQLVILLGANLSGKPHLALMIGDQYLETQGFNATAMVKELGKFIQGGGGGQPFFATAGGKNLEGLQQAINHLENLLGK